MPTGRAASRRNRGTVGAKEPTAMNKPGYAQTKRRTKSPLLPRHAAEMMTCISGWTELRSRTVIVWRTHRIQTRQA